MINDEEPSTPENSYDDDIAKNKTISPQSIPNPSTAQNLWKA